jgi:hypothetical protein
MLGGGEELEVDVATATSKLPSTGVKSPPSRTSPSLEETSSVSGQTTKLRLVRSGLTGGSLRMRSGGGDLLETGESSTVSSWRVPKPGVT